MTHFDDIIRDKLDGLRLPEVAPDWDALQERLDGETFDERLRNAFPAGALSAAAFGDGSPSSQWDALAQRLDADAGLEADEFDRIIARRLSRSESALEPAESWRQLSRRMDTLWPLRRVLVRYRVPEIAVAALMLFSFLPLLRDNATLDRFIGREPSEVADLRSREPQGGGQRGGRGFGESPYLIGSEKQAPLAGANVPGVLTPREIADLLAVYDETRTGQRRPTTEPTDYIPGLTVLTDMWERLTEVRTTALPTAALPVLPNADVAPAPQSSVLVLASKALDPLELAAPKLALPKTFDPRPNWHYGVSGGMSAVHIVTPADEAFEVERRSQRLIVPQIGLQASYDLQRRLRLGFSSSILTVSYDPGLPEVTRELDRFTSNSAYTEDFRSISVDVLRASTDLRVGLRQPARRMQVWAKAGVGTQLAMRTSYDIQRAATSARATGVPIANPEPNTGQGFGGSQARPQRPLVSTATPSDVKDLSNGILQGGGLRENRQLFGRVGAEAEWQIGERLHVFGAVDLDAAFPGQRGFGPNRDRFYTVNAEVGARVNL